MIVYYRSLSAVSMDRLPPIIGCFHGPITAHYRLFPWSDYRPLSAVSMARLPPIIGDYFVQLYGDYRLITG
jgi:hypothetical protein